MQETIGSLVAGLVMVGSAAYALIGLRVVYLGIASRFWQQTECEIPIFEYRENPEGYRTILATVRYTYAVGQSKYVNGRLYFGDRFIPLDKSHLPELINNVNERIVFVNPRNPEQAVMLNRVPRTIILPLVGAISICIMASFLLIGSLM